jgi:hypothetical protein
MDDLINKAMTTGGDAGVAYSKQINELYAKDLPYAPLLDFVWVYGERTDTKKWLQLEPSSFLHVTPQS